MTARISKSPLLNLLWLIAAGLIVVCTSVKICTMADCFVFGSDHVSRPIPELVMYLGIWFAAYFAVLEMIRRSSDERSSAARLIWILFVGVIIRIVFFPPHLIQETDPYRYMWDGQVMVQGGNPYQLSPQESFQTNAVPAAGNPEADQMVRLVNYPAIRTIYPPLAQFLFAMSQWLTPWSFLGWKWMIVAADIMIVGLLFMIIKRLNIRREWILLYVWSPLILKEFYNSLHLDIFALLFICLMIYGLSCRKVVLSLAALACAISVKWFALILVPIFLQLTWTGFRKAFLYFSLLAGIVGGLYLPFLSAGHLLWEGLSAFSMYWRVNDGIFSLILYAVEGDRLISRVLVGGLFIGIMLLVIWWLAERKDIRSFCSAALIVTASLFFLSPTGNPWYYSWIFPFLLIIPVRSLILFSGLVLLYYLDFYFMYHNQDDIFKYVRMAEYGIFFTVLGAELWIARKRLVSSFPFTMKIGSSSVR